MCMSTITTITTCTISMTAKNAGMSSNDIILTWPTRNMNSSNDFSYISVGIKFDLQGDLILRKKRMWTIRDVCNLSFLLPVPVTFSTCTDKINITITICMVNNAKIAVSWFKIYQNSHRSDIMSALRTCFTLLNQKQIFIRADNVLP